MLTEISIQKNPNFHWPRSIALHASLRSHFRSLRGNVDGESKVQLVYAVRLWSEVHPNGPKETKWRFWSALLKVLTTTPSRCCGLSSAQKPSKVAASKQFCKKEWDKVSLHRCEGLISRYPKHFVALAAAKKRTTSFPIQQINELGFPHILLVYISFWNHKYWTNLDKYPAKNRGNDTAAGNSFLTAL